MAHGTLEPNEVRQAFIDAGLAVGEWADTHGFRRESVYAVLSGRSKGHRGQAHKIAVALGLKVASSAAARFLVGTPVGMSGGDSPLAGLSQEVAPMS